MTDAKNNRIVVASNNPVKVAATLAGFKRMFPDQTFTAEGLSVPSGVADQPLTDEETLQGALNRAQNARIAVPDADFWVGLEGGVAPHKGALTTFAWIVVLGKDRQGQARSGTFFLPPAVTALVEQGMELGQANDQIFEQIHSKQKGGAIGILSGGALDRKELYAQAVVLALVPFLNEALYPASI